MAFNADFLVKDQISTYAEKIGTRIRHLKNQLLTAKSLIEADDYGTVLVHINNIRTFEKDVQGVVDLQIAGEVVQRMRVLFNFNDVNLSDLNSFRVALNDIRRFVRTNSSAFPLTYSADNDNFEFKTSPGESIKAELSSLIDAALSFVS